MEDRCLTLATRKRYFEAVRKIVPLLEISDKSWDEQLIEWIQHQYETGEGITTVNDTLCGLHHFAPFCKGTLVRSWRLFRVWRRIEKPLQAPPLPLFVFLGLLARALEMEQLSLAVLLCLGFWGMLRTGEMLKVERRHILQYQGTLVIQLGQTKTGLRRAVDENVVLYDTVSNLIIGAFLQMNSGEASERIWTSSPE